MTSEINPQACNSRDVARVFGISPADVAKWVRDGCPCTPSGGQRSPLVFNIPQVARWHFVWKAYHDRGEGAGLLAEKQVEVWDLELALEVGKREAERLLGRPLVITG